MRNKTNLIFDHDGSQRIDQFLADKYMDYSRTYFQNLIESKDILVNGAPIKANYKLKNKDKIEINFIEKTSEYDLKPANIKLDIIFENDDVIVINKQPGIVVHPAAGNKENTLVNALVNYFPEIEKAVYDQDSEISRIRPGLVHRLDKDTSGVMIVAKNARAMHSLSRQIQNRNVVKKYVAICYGLPKNEKGTLTNFLGRHPKNRKLIAEVGESKGKIAISNYHFLKNFLHEKNSLSLIGFDIKTGRTHQIRVQAKMMGCSVLGDRVYGSRESIKYSDQHGISRQMLHAKELTITLPGEDKPSKFEAALPEDFDKVLKSIT